MSEVGGNWVTLEAAAHVGTLRPGDQDRFNLDDPETRAMAAAGLFRALDETTAAQMPPLVNPPKGKDCGCGGRKRA